MLLLWTGCATTHGVALRETPKNPLADQLMLFAKGGPRPSERTAQLLRRLDLDNDWNRDPAATLVKLHALLDHEPTSEIVYAYAELAYISAAKTPSNSEKTALDLYGTSVTNAYLYLFDRQYGAWHNHYDPQFRSACDLYNNSLENVLRIVRKQGALAPGGHQSIELAGQAYDVTVVPRGDRWAPDEFDHFEFCSDYQIQGLKNEYHGYGLGVPLVAVRKNKTGEYAAEKFYPPGLSFPVTAFLRVLPDDANGSTIPGVRHRAIIELYDTLVSSELVIDGRNVPLESDLSTPLAFFLDNPAFRDTDLATLGLLFPDKTRKMAGIYMLEPYDPNKIPVLMVHGVWSTPITWMEMFNDLRSQPDLRSHYQFWFYLYPTGQPFWISARQLRDDLAYVRASVDPQHAAVALDQMVLVGHSMGGLVARLQTLDSHDDFWHIMSDKPIADLKAAPEIKEGLAKTFYFEANPSIRRVITIATPHRGSAFANDTTRYLGRKLISLPTKLVQGSETLRRDNPGFFRDSDVLAIPTSIDSLAPSSPILPVMLAAARGPWVKYNNIVGVLPSQAWYDKLVGEGPGDGIVPFSSAHLDDVESEIVVEADHSGVHQHPKAVLEVRRILLEHLAELRGIPSRNAIYYRSANPQN
ncbi:MAG TPA: alpha/beta fold hydrolase [Pirellulales bacterium]|jgi:pimeloyl-ACP methyl ester carboxylesterase|nr:alpha/beta fold hydrolase [Pirellulales bacterium]